MQRLIGRGSSELKECLTSGKLEKGGGEKVEVQDQSSRSEGQGWLGESCLMRDTMALFMKKK